MMLVASDPAGFGQRRRAAFPCRRSFLLPGGPLRPRRRLAAHAWVCRADNHSALPAPIDRRSANASPWPMTWRVRSRQAGAGMEDAWPEDLFPHRRHPPGGSVIAFPVVYVPASVDPAGASSVRPLNPVPSVPQKRSSVGAPLASICGSPGLSRRAPAACFPILLRASPPRRCYRSSFQNQRFTAGFRRHFRRPDATKLRSSTESFKRHRTDLSTGTHQSGG